MESLSSLNIPDGVLLDILAVDNGSTDSTKTLLEQKQTKFTGFTLRILQEIERGKANALNKGLSDAKGNVILILDDDVVVDSQCLVQHLKCYRTTEFDALQGRVLPGVDAEGKPADSSRLLEYNVPIVDYGLEIREIRGLTGTNISFKREVVEKVGFFDTRLGPGISGFSEDTEFAMRVRQAGFKIGYAPYAIAYHELDPKRYGRAYNRMVQYRKGISRSIYRRESVVMHALPNLLVNSIRYIFYKFLGKRLKAFKTEGRIMRYWGYILGRAKKRMGRVF